jgi:hypothetical protein
MPSRGKKDPQVTWDPELLDFDEYILRQWQYAFRRSASDCRCCRSLPNLFASAVMPTGENLPSAQAVCASTLLVCVIMFFVATE